MNGCTLYSQDTPVEFQFVDDFGAVFYLLLDWSAIQALTLRKDDEIEIDIVAGHCMAQYIDERPSLTEGRYLLRVVRVVKKVAGTYPGSYGDPEIHKIEVAVTISDVTLASEMSDEDWGYPRPTDWDYRGETPDGA